jgi:hypothetical protein
VAGSRSCVHVALKPEQLELELLAREIRRRAGLDEDDFELATKIAARVLGPDAIALEPKLQGAAYLRRTFEGFQIVLNPGAKDVRFHVAHELGEWALKSLAHFTGSELERERAANYIAAAILAPEPAVRRAHAQVGEKIRTLAARFGMSQTSIVLRLAEVRGDERAVVTRTGNVLLRSAGAFPWADVRIVDAARGDAWRGLGLAKASLRGGIDEGRVALRVR